MLKLDTMLPDNLNYITQIPQRYTVNHYRYAQRNGKVEPEDILGFASHGYTTDFARYYFFALTFDQICKENIAGNLAELGVYKGNTASFLAKIARRLDRTLYLLDTFEGFSERDLTAVDSDKAMQFADTSVEAVETLVGRENVSFVKGYFPDTASQLPNDGQYCLVHIDCDLYAPFKSALDYFWPRLSPGGFLVMHDYASLHWSGAEKAVDEFFAGKAEAVVPVPDASGSVVVRKSYEPGFSKSWLFRSKLSKMSGAWIPADVECAAEFLEEGWSGVEPWGVWGLGGKHVLRVPRSKARSLEMDVMACLVGKVTTQTVDVFCEGEKVAEWHFSTEENRALRTMPFLSEADDKIASHPFVSFELRPRSVAAPKDLDPGSADDRLLGIGLYRFRASIDYR